MSEEKPKKSLKKKLAIVLALVIVLLVVVPFLVIYGLSAAVKVGGETAVTMLTKGETTIGGAYINVFAGQVVLKDILIKNPKVDAENKPTEFKTEDFFKLGELDFDLDIMSLTGNEITVSKILVRGPEITYEKSLTSSNLDVILKNLEAVSGGAKKDTTEEEKKETTEEKSEKTFVIKDLLIEDTQVTLSSFGLTAPMPLPTIHLTDLGKPNQGLTAAEAITETFKSLFSAIFDGAKKIGVSVLNFGKDTGNSAAEGGKKAYESGKEALKNSAEAIKGLFK